MDSSAQPSAYYQDGSLCAHGEGYAVGGPPQYESDEDDMTKRCRG